MNSAFAIKVPNYTAPAGAITVAKMLGGTPLYPVAPTVSTLVSALPFTPSLICVDPAGVNAYMSDTANNNIWQVNLQTGISTKILNNTVAPGLGTTSTGAVCLTCSADGTLLYVLTNKFTIVTIGTTAPYTMTSVVGTNGTAGTTDGAGSGALINSNVGSISLDTSGAFLYLWDGNTGNKLRKITIAGWNVTTLATYTAGVSNHPNSDISGSGFGYSESLGVLYQTSITSGAAVNLGQIPGLSTGTGIAMPDSQKPNERCIYVIPGSSTAVWRYDLQTSTWTQIATLSSAWSGPGNTKAACWSNGKLLVLSGTNILQVA